MPAISHTEKAEVSAWFARMDGARRVWDQIKGERNRLKRSLALRSSEVSSYGQQQGGELDEDWDQRVSIPLDAKVASYLKSKAHDHSPEIRTSGMRGGDLKTGPMNSHLLRRVTEMGGLPRASRSAIDDMLTLGAWIVRFGIEDEVVDPRRLEGVATDVAEVVALAMTGEAVHPVPGMDLLLLAATARDRLADPNNIYGLTPQQRETVQALAQEADAMFVEEQKKPRPLPSYRFWFKRSPYGTRTLMDSTVFMREDAQWMAFLSVFNEEQFQRCERFTQTARNKCRPSSDRQDREDDTAIHDVNPEFDEPNKKRSNRYDVWEVHDRLNFKVRYVCDGYEGFLDEDMTPWYADENGRNAFDDGFPCEWAVPFTHNIEDATQPLGVPALLYGESVKNEFQILRSAHLANAKRSARIAEVEGELDEEDEAQLREARDGSFIKKSGPTVGTDRPMIRPIEWPAAPTDLLQASQVAEGDYYTLCSVNASSLNGQQQAGTATQEVIINQGANNIQGDMVSVVEEAYQRLVRKVATIIRLVFTPTNAMRYVSPEYAMPGPNGEPAPFSAWKKESLDGLDISVSFSTKGREPNPIRMKTYMDAIALSLKAIDPITLMPYKDPRPLLDGLYAEMGWGKVPDFQMSKDAMIVMAMQKAMASQKPGGENGQAKPSANGNAKGREAGGERGGGKVPNRQDRAEKPGMAGDQFGAGLRVGTA